MITGDKSKRDIQLFFLSVSIVVFALLISGLLEAAHSFCPMAGMCFGCLKAGQKLTATFFPWAAIFGILLLIYTIFKGRIFCGYACPFGTI